ncbi:AAA family ATPase [Pseudoalteromonas agarivorans]|uniref:AAA family ATPase n=1 Tax=Pseudoalteromonas agarivorans TaxID=176102 RepID=UPI0003D648A3|nr:AAA family ATPase [Pseudoalteromonas agarivorans]ETJ46837.1 hypothetical protein X564_17405 [Pseudoalteromonas agarivorans]
MESRKRLLFFWIESYKIHKDLGICLVNDYDIIFDRFSGLRVSKKQNYPAVFKNLQNIIVFVGKNATGKSTALEIVDAILCDYLSGKYFAVFENFKHGKPYLEIYAPNFSNADKVKRFLNLTLNQDVTINTEFSDLTDFKLGLIRASSNTSPDLPYNIAKSEQHPTRRRHEIRSSTLLSSDAYKPFSTWKLLEEVVDSEINDELQFNKENIYLNFFSITKENQERLVHPRAIQRYLKNTSINSTSVEEASKNILRKLNEFKSELDEGVFWLTFGTLRQLSELWYGNKEGGIYFFYFFISDQIEKRQDKLKIVKLEDAFTHVNNFFKENRDLISRNKETGSWDIRFHLSTNSPQLLSFIRELRLYQEIIPGGPLYGGFAPKWEGLSSGQLNILRLFSGLKDLTFAKRIEADSDGVIVLLDEIETSFHPEWQRKVISYLQRFIQYFCHFSLSKTQIIIATHSPFILSDTLNENVKYFNLEGNSSTPIIMSGAKDGKKSFAGNIHELLSDRFFMEATVGKHAENLISELQLFFSTTERNDIESSHDKKQSLIKTYEEAEAAIEQISDSVLKSYFEAELIKYSSIEKRWSDDIEQYRKAGDIDSLIQFLKDKNIV